MTREKHIFHLFRCEEIGCGQSWWTTDDETDPMHDCTAKDPERRFNPTVITLQAVPKEGR